MRDNDNDWSVWGPVLAAGIAAGLVIAHRAQNMSLGLDRMLVAAAAVTVGTFLFTVLEHANTAQSPGWRRVYVFRVVVCLAAGAWMTWTAIVGWTQGPLLALLGGTVTLAAFGHLCRTPQPVQVAGQVPADGRDRRAKVVREWEARMRSITRQAVTVTGVQSWDNPADGMRLHVELPAEAGMTTTDLAAYADKFASSARLPQGCAVRVLDSDRQGTAVVDVMLRDCLTDEVRADEDITPVSINDEFVVMTSPRGELLKICLRIMSMIIGGTVGSGKTTLLHRIIMRLARCTDALIWVVDTNGGGLAEPWINPWARGDASRPVVDWVADNEEEAAVLVAVAAAIAKDRKTSKEATRRKRAANETILPVGKELPAIIVLTDEGGEVRQAVSVFGRAAAEGITRLAQIGRAEGVRVIMSVLRGTLDLLDKGLRVTAGLRLCLRMEEEEEYGYVLGANPGRTRLLHPGSAYLRRPSDPKPIFGRTVNLLLDAMDRHAIACADLRPDLDEQAQRVAARVSPQQVLGGRTPDPAILRLQVMRDAAAGRAYEGRWDRYAAKLAEMCGDDPVDVDDVTPDPAPQSTATLAPPLTGALARMAALVEGMSRATVEPAVDLDDQAAVDAEAQRLLDLDWTETQQQATTTRDRIVEMVDEAGAEGISSAAIEQGVGVSHARVYGLLGELRNEGRIRYRDPEQKGVYVTPRNARLI